MVVTIYVTNVTIVTIIIDTIYKINIIICDHIYIFIYKVYGTLKKW